jgi:hypothetical protein
MFCKSAYGIPIGGHNAASRIQNNMTWNHHFLKQIVIVELQAQFQDSAVKWSTCSTYTFTVIASWSSCFSNQMLLIMMLEGLYYSVVEQRLYNVEERPQLSHSISSSCPDSKQHSCMQTVFFWHTCFHVLWVTDALLSSMYIIGNICTFFKHEGFSRFLITSGGNLSHDSCSLSNRLFPLQEGWMIFDG